MAQEESVSGCHYSGAAAGGGGSGGGRGGGGGSGSGSCRPKKIKPKKVPQRGLGVAQLEKIILEEQQKESLQTANILAKNAIASPSDPTSFLAVQKFRPNLPPFHNSVPLPPPPPSPSNLSSSSNALFRHAQSAPNIEILQESCSVLKHSTSGAGEIGSRAISSPIQDSLPRLWGGGGQCNLLEKQRLDHHGFAIDPQGILPYELRTPLSPQRSHHFQPPSSSMVQSGISPSSVLSSHLEPPSNQSSHPNNYAPQWSVEDKIVGMKRSYPFTLESSYAPSSLLCNFRPSYAASSSRPDELALCSSGYTAVAEPRNKYIRANPLLEQMPSEVIRDDNDDSLNGDFLTLAPPSSASTCSISKHNHHSGYECRPSQEHDMSHIHQPESSGSVKQSFNFFPIKLPTDPNTNCVRKGKDDNVDTIDLNLKL